VFSSCRLKEATLTERVGFEPTVLNKEHTGFRNQLDQPLRHLSETAPAAALTFAETTILYIFTRQIARIIGIAGI
jgi:hypothetical protein